MSAVLAVTEGALALRRNFHYRRSSELRFPRYVIAANLNPHLALTANTIFYLTLIKLNT